MEYMYYFCDDDQKEKINELLEWYEFTDIGIGDLKVNDELRNQYDTKIKDLLQQFGIEIKNKIAFYKGKEYQCDMDHVETF